MSVPCLTLYFNNLPVKMRCSARLDMAMRAYCDRQGLPLNNTPFRVKKTDYICHPDDTPDSLNLQEGDVILAVRDADNV